MKTKLFAIITLSLLSSSVFSQKFALGIKGGASLGKISGKAFKDEFTLGYHAGAFATIGIGKFGIQPEVLFNQINLDTANKFSQVYQFNHINNVKLQHLTIPVLLNYNLASFLTLQAGPQFGILLDKNKNLLQNGGDAFKQGNFSLVGGVQVKVLKFRAYGRFVGGLTNLDNIDKAETWKTQSIQLGIGYSLF